MQKGITAMSCEYGVAFHKTDKEILKLKPRKKNKKRKGYLYEKEGF